MSDLIREMMERERELRRLMNPLAEAARDVDMITSAALRAAAGLDLNSEVARAAAGLIQDAVTSRAEAGYEIMRLLDERAECEALAAGFMSAAQYHDLAFDVIQRSDTPMALAERMKREALLAPGLQDWNHHTTLMIAASGAHKQWQDAFRLPLELEARDLVRQQIEAAQAYAPHFDGRAEQEVMAAITGMSHPWLNSERIEQSVLGLVDMQAVGAALRHADPFAAETSDVLRAALGDWRDEIAPAFEALVDPVARTALYHDQGFSPGLTAFPRPAFVEGLRRAGLDLEEVDVDESDNTEGDGETDEETAFARNRAAFDQLQRFEVAMRRFIDSRMTEVFGPNWIATQTPDGISDSWHQKQAKEAQASGEEKSLIEFADFADYRPIIERKQNWKTAFAPVFTRQTDIQESFQRLYPVRIATMHARMITQDDEMLLAVETRRILKAIRGTKKR